MSNGVIHPSGPKQARQVRLPKNLLQFYSHVQITEDCWLWTGSITRDGYGMFNRQKPHRIVYQMAVGDLTPGLVIDHVCRVHGCVNPTHLEQVTQRENILRGTAPTAVNAQREVCKWGHPLAPVTAGVHKGKRYCPTCRRKHWTETAENRKIERRLRHAK